MGTLVKDGNSCIGCSSLEEFPKLCGSCRNFKSATEIAVVASDFKSKLDKANKLLDECEERLEKIATGEHLDEADEGAQETLTKLREGRK